MEEDDDTNPLTTPPPEAHDSSVFTAAGLATYMLRCVCCTIIFIVLLWIVAFCISCTLLHRANTPAVRSECAGFWDFMLISLLSPFLIPSAYCMLYCVTTRMQWHLFSGACMVVFAISSLYMTLAAASNHACTEAIRETAPPFPWLILIGWFNAAAYGAGALSSLWGSTVERTPAPSPA